MRKHILSILPKACLLMLIVACLTLSGCGQKISQTPKPCEEIVAAIGETPGLFEELTPQNRAAIVAYFGLDDELLVDAALWMDASAATTEMVAALTAKDEAAMKDTHTEVSMFLDDLIDTYRDYAPEEVPKLKGAVLEVRGRQLVLIVSKDATKAKAALDTSTKR